jgi:hypothetical protein
MWDARFQISKSEKPQDYEGTLVELYALACTPFRPITRESGFREVRGQEPPYSIWVTSFPFGRLPALDLELLLREIKTRLSALPGGSIVPPSCGEGG